MSNFPTHYFRSIYIHFFSQGTEAAILVAQLLEEMSIKVATIVNIKEGIVAVGVLITIIGIEGATMERIQIQKTIGQVIRLYID